MIRSTLSIIRYNKTYCTLIATIILAAYAVNLVPEMDKQDQYPDYFRNILPLKMQCDYEFDTRGFLKYWANCFSYQYIGHDKIIPIISSVAVVYLTYVLANTITNNRMIGLIAMGAMTVNPLLTKFDSSPTYDQLWVAFFLLSIFLLYKKPVIGFLSYPLSIISKILSAAYLPGIILTIFVDKRLQNKKVIVGICTMSAVGIAAVIYQGTGSVIGIYPDRLLDGFLRIFESIWAIFPFVIGMIVIDRFFMPKEKPDGKMTVIVWMVWILLTTPMIYLFTKEQMQFGYRFVPFASFFSIYVGIVLVQLGNFVTEARLRKQSLKSISHR